MQMFPSQVTLPPFLTLFGMLAVSSSSKRWTIPRSSRKPTMILGTPSKNDCAQNFSSFRSYFTMSRSFLISADVLSSTQWITSSFRAGLQSQTVKLLACALGEVQSSPYRHQPRPQLWVASCLFLYVQLSSIGRCCSQLAHPGIRSLHGLSGPMAGWEEIVFRICTLIQSTTRH